MLQKDGKNLQLPKCEVLAHSEVHARNIEQIFLVEELTQAAEVTGKHKLEIK